MTILQKLRRLLVSSELKQEDLDFSAPLASLKKMPTPQRLAARISYWSEGAFPGNLIHLSRDEVKFAKGRELISLAAMNAEAGRLNRAVELVERALRRDRDILRKYRYAGLVASIEPFISVVRRDFSSEVGAINEYRAHIGKFQSIVQSAGRSIAVVGNSPTNQGSGLGQEIDKRKIVIRFNNYSLDPKYSPDYGTRTDIWVQNPNYMNVWRRDHQKFLHRLLPVPLYWRAIHGQDFMLAASQFNFSVEEVYSQVYCELRAGLGAPPSSGLSILSLLNAMLGTLDDVLVVGFGLDDQKKSVQHYFPSPERLRTPLHNWEREHEFFRQLVHPSK